MFSNKTVLVTSCLCVVPWFSKSVDTRDRNQWRASVNTEMNLPVPKKPGNFLSSWVTTSFSRRITLHGAS